MNSRLRYGLVVALMFCHGGCQRRAEHRLIGTWVGRPTIVSRITSAALEQSGGSGTKNAQSDTVLSNLDIVITLQLDSDNKVLMWRNENEQRLSGTWKLLSVDKDQARMQIAADSSGDNGQPEVRNFKIIFLEEGDQFELSEEGADPQFGSLTFHCKD